VGDYELLELLGQGPAGRVCTARQLSTGTVVALKVLSAGVGTGAQAKRRLRLKAAESLDHPNIIRIYEVGEHEGQLYVAMEYIGGASLARLPGGRPLPPMKAAAWLKTAAEAIEYAHQLGVLHQDLKPSNILIGPGERLAITDFGLAGWNEAGSNQALGQTAPGATGFLAPELASVKCGIIGPASDVYGLGAILYYMLTGRAPFDTQPAAETLQQAADLEPAPPRSLDPAIPSGLEMICLRCLEKAPARRYASAQALADDVERFIRSELNATPRLGLEPPPPAPQPGRGQPAGAWVAAGILLLALAAAGFAVWKLQPPRLVQIRGQVVDFDDHKQALAAALVSLGSAHTVADPSGEFTLSIPRQQLASATNLTVRAAGHQPYIQTVAPGAVPPEVRLRKAVTSFSLVILLHGPGGTNDRVVLDGSQVMLNVRDWSANALVTNERNAYFDSLPNGLSNQAALVSIVAPDWRLSNPALSIPLRGGTPIPVQVEPAGMNVSGRVRDFDGQGSVAQAHVSLGSLTTNSDTKGEFSFYVPGTNVSRPMTLVVKARGYADHRQDWTPQPGLLEVPLHKAVFAQVVVFHGPDGTTNGMDLEGSRVALQVQGSTFPASILHGCEARFDGLPLGLSNSMASVVFNAKGWRLSNGAGTIRLGGGASSQAQVERASVLVRGSVRDIDSKLPVPRATVSLSGVSTNTDADGGFILHIPGDEIARSATLAVAAGGYCANNQPVPPQPGLCEIWLARPALPEDVAEVLKSAENERVRNPPWAEKIYLEAIKKAPTSPECLISFGEFLRAQGRLGDSLSNLEAAVVWARTSKNKASQAAALNAKGIVQYESGRYAEAKDSYTEALNLYEALRKPDNDLDRAQCFENRGLVFLRPECHDNALALRDYQRAFEIRKGAVRPDDKEGQVELAQTMIRLAEVRADAGDRAGASNWLFQAVSRGRQLARQDARKYAPSLASMLTTWARRAGDWGQRGKSLELYKEAVDVYREIEALDPKLAQKADYALALNAYAVALADAGEPTQDRRAREVYTDALAAFDGLPPEALPRWALTRAVTLGNLAVLLGRLGETKEAREKFEAAILAYAKAKPMGSEELARMESNYGAFLDKSGQDREAALQFYRKSLARYKELQASGRLSDWEGYASTLNECAAMVAPIDGERSSPEAFHEALRMYKDAADLCASNSFYKVCVQVLRNFAVLWENSDDFSEAQAKFEAAQGVCERIKNQPEYNASLAEVLLGRARLELNWAAKGEVNRHRKRANDFCKKAESALASLAGADSPDTRRLRKDLKDLEIELSARPVGTAQ
jgi:tetratricopeptide (TPR) repeat protein